ncbi:metallophosphoesterase [Draconibacterium sp. IB214405]|uniref:metallophosphoesterase family protein n=1 Tax=Draconibacterium sp. IB214405 TaxID=3097352 RepID=UPI002A0FEE9B|nr:metallophosphoesterase [Draconibacterium sp. IB214405]MDX8337733.1 metallophosphoesterase [Draconibacterium sp. IB214405]
MKKIALFLTILFCVYGFTQAQNSTNPELKFNAEGKFKILQFTDIHFKYNSFRSDSVLLLMKAAVNDEKPDLVVLTGDVVCSKHTKKAWLKLATIFTEAEVPWAVTLGNHDIEEELTGKEIMETICDLPYCITEDGPEEISGNGNYVLKVRSHSSEKTEAVLYCIDSHSGLKKEAGLGSYDWIKWDQVNWYREQSRKLTAENNGNPYPALAFFHIPLPEYNQVWGMETTIGVKNEKVCSPDINSGMYNAFVESEDVMAMFVGHDHVNNYIGELRGICMVYGQATGRETYGGIPKGYRVIELYEGQRKFDTWVREKYECDNDKGIWTPVNSREKKYFVTYPDSFAGK